MGNQDPGDVTILREREHTLRNEIWALRLHRAVTREAAGGREEELARALAETQGALAALEEKERRQL